MYKVSSKFPFLNSLFGNRLHKITLLFFLIYQFGFSQNYTEYATGSAQDMVVSTNGGICLMGGATENDEAMRWFLRQANGGDIVVLRASGSDGYNDYFYTDLGVAINSVTTFVIDNEAGALNPYVLNKVANAEGIWFAGGDQYNYVSFFKDNAMENTLNTFINTKKGVIGGTSAGMAILGSAYFSAENGTVTNAQALNNPYHSRMTLGYNDFLQVPFLEHVITDTHYDDPDRRARHGVFLARYATDTGMRSFGIASNEYTAVCVDATGRSFVYGDYPNYEEYAFFLQANCVENYEPENCTNGTPLNWNNNGEAIKVYKVPGTNNGANYFDISNWETGSGGSWENWYVVNGTFVTASGENPQCNSLTVSEFKTVEIAVYPNPFEHVIYIKSEVDLLGIQLLDVSGKAIEVSVNSNAVDVSFLGSGIYFIRINIGTETQTFKLLKN